jgi:hypothetical protein
MSGRRSEYGNHELTGGTHLAAMVRLFAVLLFLLPIATAAQPADCARAPDDGAVLPLALDLAGRPGVPAGTSGQAFVGIPLGSPGYACHTVGAPQSDDALRGDAGDVLHGPPSRDLLRGPGEPHVRMVPAVRGLNELTP